jgi:apolipoprotein D and lipocalin family protein
MCVVVTKLQKLYFPHLINTSKTTMSHMNGSMSIWIVVVLIVGIVLVVWGMISWFSWRSSKSGPSDLAPVEVDWEQYQGDWYEIARLPTSFQNKNCRDTKANYLIHPNKSVRVVNSCVKDGTRQVSEGWAEVRAPGILSVSFFPWVYGNYTVVKKTEDTAIVCNADKTLGWILHREKTMDDKTRQDNIDWMEARGFNTQNIILN